METKVIQFRMDGGYPLDNIQTRLFIKNAASFFEAMANGFDYFTKYCESPIGTTMNTYYKLLADWRRSHA